SFFEYDKCRFIRLEKQGYRNTFCCFCVKGNICGGARRWIPLLWYHSFHTKRHNLTGGSVLFVSNEIDFFTVSATVNPVHVCLIFILHAYIRTNAHFIQYVAYGLAPNHLAFAMRVF